MLSILAIGTLGGCSLFHHRTDYYNKATETRPLEVPPDLDAPVASNELTVPATGNAAPAAAASTSTAPPVASNLASGTPASSAGAVLTDEGVGVADSPAHTWQRVGLALERAQVGTISARDESARTYTLQVSGLGAAQPEQATEHHWYTRILHPFGGDKSKAQPVSGVLTVRVSDDGKGGARVRVEGQSSDSNSGEAARRVLEVLRDRLS